MASSSSESEYSPLLHPVLSPRGDSATHLGGVDQDTKEESLSSMPAFTTSESPADTESDLAPTRSLSRSRRASLSATDRMLVLRRMSDTFLSTVSPRRPRGQSPKRRRTLSMSNEVLSSLHLLKDELQALERDGVGDDMRGAVVDSVIADEVAVDDGDSVADTQLPERVTSSVSTAALGRQRKDSVESLSAAATSVFTVPRKQSVASQRELHEHLRDRDDIIMLLKDRYQTILMIVEQIGSENVQLTQDLDAANEDKAHLESELERVFFLLQQTKQAEDLLTQAMKDMEHRNAEECEKQQLEVTRMAESFDLLRLETESLRVQNAEMTATAEIMRKELEAFNSDALDKEEKWQDKEHLLLKAKDAIEDELIESRLLVRQITSAGTTPPALDSVGGGYMARVSDSDEFAESSEANEREEELLASIEAFKEEIAKLRAENKTLNSVTKRSEAKIQDFERRMEDTMSYLTDHEELLCAMLMGGPKVLGKQLEFYEEIYETCQNTREFLGIMEAPPPVPDSKQFEATPPPPVEETDTERVFVGAPLPPVFEEKPTVEFKAAMSGVHGVDDQKTDPTLEFASATTGVVHNAAKRRKRQGFESQTTGTVSVDSATERLSDLDFASVTTAHSVDDDRKQLEEDFSAAKSGVYGRDARAHSGLHFESGSTGVVSVSASIKKVGGFKTERRAMTIDISPRKHKKLRPRKTPKGKHSLEEQRLVLIDFFCRYSDPKNWKGRRLGGTQMFGLVFADRDPIEARMSFLYALTLYLSQIVGIDKRCLSHAFILLKTKAYQIETLSKEFKLILETLGHHDNDKLWRYVYSFLFNAMGYFKHIAHFIGTRTKAKPMDARKMTLRYAKHSVDSSPYSGPAAVRSSAHPLPVGSVHRRVRAPQFGI